MFYITISNGLLTPEHWEKMGACVWQYMWCIDKVTKIDDEGMGWVLGGKPINLDDLPFGSRITNSRNLNELEKKGYLKLIHTPYGISIRVIKAKKRFTKNDKPKSFIINDKPRTENDKPNKTVSVDKVAKTGSDFALHKLTIQTGEQDYDFDGKTERVIPYPFSVGTTRAAWQSGEVRLQVLCWFFDEKDLWKTVRNSNQLKIMMARHSNAAKQIARADWTPADLKKGREKIRQNGDLEDEWTLETIIKYLSK